MGNYMGYNGISSERIDIYIYIYSQQYDNARYVMEYITNKMPFAVCFHIGASPIGNTHTSFAQWGTWWSNGTCGRIISSVSNDPRKASRKNSRHCFWMRTRDWASKQCPQRRWLFCMSFCLVMLYSYIIIYMYVSCVIIFNICFSCVYTYWNWSKKKVMTMQNCDWTWTNWGFEPEMMIDWVCFYWSICWYKPRQKSFQLVNQSVERNHRKRTGLCSAQVVSVQLVSSLKGCGA